MKTGIDWYKIGLRCKHESCRDSVQSALNEGRLKFRDKTKPQMQVVTPLSDKIMHMI
ncbi:hypothetical protein MTR_4g054775 [Medicago truncatula]|uniref:Uncharacterized protein n=1 Tax=Medicago truncatula TaxID=3880 RepID=A0A072UJR4_MEDTR|nr:hypothetical protein MTR_4g054775 [Medicago truncatula]